MEVFVRITPGRYSLFHSYSGCFLRGSGEVSAVKKEDAIKLGLKPCFCMQRSGLSRRENFDKSLSELVTKVAENIEKKTVSSQEVFRLQQVVFDGVGHIDIKPIEKLLEQAREVFNQNVTLDYTQALRELIRTEVLKSSSSDSFFLEVTALKRVIQEGDSPAALLEHWLDAWVGGLSPQEASTRVLSDVTMSQNESFYPDAFSNLTFGFSSHEDSRDACLIIEAWVEQVLEEAQKRPDVILLLDRRCVSALNPQDWDLFASQKAFGRQGVIAVRATYIQSTLLQARLPKLRTRLSSPVQVLSEAHDNWDKSIETMFVISGLFEGDEPVNISHFDANEKSKISTAWEAAKALEGQE